MLIGNEDKKILEQMKKREKWRMTKIMEFNVMEYV